MKLKRFLSVLLALTMVCSMTLVSASAAGETMATIFPDANFRAAVVESFTDAGFNDPSALTDTVLVDALAAFDGTINASKKRITDAHGLEYLTGAMEVNLSKNQITEWSFLEQTKNPNGVHHYEYKGGDGDYGNNVYWNLDGNPFSVLPKEFGGNLVIKQMATTASIYEENFRPRVFVRDAVGEDLNGTFNITRCQIKDPATGNVENAKAVSANLIAPNILTIGDFGQLNIRLTFSLVQKTGRQTIGVGIDQDVHYTTSDDYGTATPGSQSFKYYIHPQFFVYDRVTLSTASDVVLTKKDSGTGTPLQGAVYTLFNGIDQEISKGHTTGADGTLILTGLIPGNYYLVETTAPAGYDLDTTHQSFTVPSVALGGGVTSVQTTYDKDDDPTSHTPPVITPTLDPVTAAVNEVLIAGPNQSLGRQTDGEPGEYVQNASPDITLTSVDNLDKVSVTVTYAALEASDPARPSPRTFTSLADAEGDVNDEKNANNIIGPVTIAVTQTGANAVKLTHTNTKTSPPPSYPSTPTVTVKGEKIWEDDDNSGSTRPASVKVELYRDGGDSPYRTATVSASNSWKYSFTGLTKYRTGNTPYVYTVREADVPEGYTSAVDSVTSSTGNTVTTTITNTLTPPEKPPETPEEPKEPGDPTDPQNPSEPPTTPPTDPGEPPTAPPGDPNDPGTPSTTPPTASPTTPPGNGILPQTGTTAASAAVAPFLLTLAALCAVCSVLFLHKRKKPD